MNNKTSIELFIYDNALAGKLYELQYKGTVIFSSKSADETITYVEKKIAQGYSFTCRRNCSEISYDI